MFLTSNRTKLQHARYFCRNYNMKIVEKNQYGVAYEEPLTSDRDKLFKESIEDAKKRLFKQTKWKDVKYSRENKLTLNRLFFLEDTSVKIHALSSDIDEIPGTEIKYWMREHDFSSLDKVLKERGNDRKVTIRSDIGLYLPPKLRETIDEDYVRFSSSVQGTITEKEYSFKTNELYPWLDNKSFNRWFIPEGYKVPISMLPEKDASKHDFRAKAFEDMLEFLEKKHIISKKGAVIKDVMQGVLPFLKAPVFLVCGLPCAGKTTIGDFLSKNYGYYHIEASDFMRLSYYERHGLGSTVLVHDFAEKALMDTPTIVVDQIFSHIDGINDFPVIITGFRSDKELELFLERYKQVRTTHAIFINAESKKRYKRSLIRDREEAFIDEKAFCERDKQQLRMGLEKIKNRLKSSSIDNNSDISAYYNEFMKKYPKDLRYDSSIPSIKRKERPKELEEAILVALKDEDKYLTTTEISHSINNFFQGSMIKTSKNNISRYFNQRFHPYYDIRIRDSKIRYCLSPTGRSRALFFLRQSLHKVV